MPRVPFCCNERKNLVAESYFGIDALHAEKGDYKHRSQEMVLTAGGSTHPGSSKLHRWFPTILQASHNPPCTLCLST